MKHARPPAIAFQGTGAAATGGRWNAVQVVVAYASASRALAVLEYLANIDKANAPRDLVFISATIDESDIETAHPPNGWNEVGSASAEIYGTQWATEQRSLVLAVPSIVLPQETNYIINPRHPRFASIVIADHVEPFSFDPRIIQ